MGRIEARERRIFFRTQPKNLPEPEDAPLLNVVYGEVKRTVRNLLINGGAILHGGKILAYRFEDLNKENLTDEELQALASKYVLSKNVSRIRRVLPEKSDPPGMEKAHIIAKNALSRLGYERAPHGRIYLSIKGESGNSASLYPYDSLSGAFTGYTKRVLVREGLVSPDFQEGRLFVGSLLLRLAREDGLGDLKTVQTNHN